MTLLAEDLAGDSGAVVGAVEVDVDYAVPVFEGVIEAACFGGDACVCDHYVEVAEVFDDCVDACLYLWYLLV